MLPQVRHFLEIGGKRGLPRSFPLNFIPETKIFKLIVKNKNLNKITKFVQESFVQTNNYILFICNYK